MSDPIFTEDKGQVTVAPAGGGPVVPLPVPRGFSAVSFRNGLAAAYTAFMAHGKIPTPAEMHEVWGRIPEKTYAELVLTDEFKQALRHRGVDWDDNSGLSYEQSLTIDKLSDPSDRRGEGAKIKDLGVSPVVLAAWKKNPLFMKVLRDRSESNLQEHLPAVMNALVGSAQGGNMQAIDRVLAMTGRYDPSNREVIVLREMIQQLLRIITLRVPDAEIRQAIADDINLAAGGVIQLEAPNDGMSR